MFSNGSSSSMSRAMVTPSLVIVGAPYFLSSTTLRPFGPERDADGVGELVDAVLEAPAGRSRRTGAAWPWGAFLSGCREARGRRPVEWRRAGSALDDREDVLLADDEELLAVDLELGAGVLRVEDLVPTLTSIGSRVPSSRVRPGPAATMVPSWGFSFAVSGITMPLLVISSRGVGWSTTRSPERAESLSCRRRRDGVVTCGFGAFMGFVAVAAIGWLPSVVGAGHIQAGARPTDGTGVSCPGGPSSQSASHGAQPVGAWIPAATVLGAGRAVTTRRGRPCGRPIAAGRGLVDR